MEDFREAKNQVNFLLLSCYNNWKRNKLVNKTWFKYINYIEHNVLIFGCGHIYVGYIGGGKLCVRGNSNERVEAMERAIRRGRFKEEGAIIIFPLNIHHLTEQTTYEVTISHVPNKHVLASNQEQHQGTKVCEKETIWMVIMCVVTLFKCVVFYIKKQYVWFLLR